VVQTEGKQQPFAGSEQEGADGSRLLDQRSDSVDHPGEQRPDDRYGDADDGHHQGGDDRYEAGSAEEGEGVGQLNRVEPAMQEVDDDPGDDAAEHPHLEGLNPHDHPLTDLLMVSSGASWPVSVR